MVIIHFQVWWIERIHGPQSSNTKVPSFYMVCIYLQVTSNEKQNTLWRPADKPIRKDQQDRVFLTAGQAIICNLLLQTFAQHRVGNTFDHQGGKKATRGNEWHWKFFNAQAFHFYLLKVLAPSSSQILVSLPFQWIFNIQPTLQTQLMLYPWVPCVPWVLPE